MIIYGFTFLDITAPPAVWVAADNLVDAVDIFDRYAKAWGEEFTGPRDALYHVVTPIAGVEDGEVPSFIMAGTYKEDDKFVPYYYELPADPSDDLYANFAIGEDLRLRLRPISV